MPQEYLIGLAGGLSIGVAAVLLMVLVGRIAGITGIAFNGVFQPTSHPWAVAFMVGLPLGAFAWHNLSETPVPAFDLPMAWLIAGGIVVGVGTRLGSGCTSGHGVCGIGRLSPRSIVATLIFMTTGVLTVFIRGLLS